MSTRVLPPDVYFTYNIRMSELQRCLQLPPVTTSSSSGSSSPSESAPPNETSPNIAPSRGVRRNLFGPIDHEENLKFVHEELNKIADADSKRWNYDFVNDTPLEGRYTWESAERCSIPPAYEMPNLTSRLAQTCSQPTTSKLGDAVSSSTRLLLPQVTPSSAEVASSRASQKEREKKADDLLQVTLQAVTTASTTVIGAVSRAKGARAPPPPPALIDPVCSLAKEASKDQRNNLPSVKQTHITDFLKIRKRPRSPSEADGKGDDPPPALLLKRTRTST